MGARAGRAALEIACEPRLELRERRRIRVVLQPRVGKAELLCTFGESRREPCKCGAALLDERGAELRDALRPRLERVAPRQSELHAAQRCVALRERREVV